MPAFFKSTNTEPFAAWFAVTGDATPDGIRGRFLKPLAFCFCSQFVEFHRVEGARSRGFGIRGAHPTRWTTIISSKVNLPYAIDFRAWYSASLVT